MEATIEEDTHKLRGKEEDGTGPIYGTSLTQLHGKYGKSLTWKPLFFLAIEVDDKEEEEVWYISKHGGGGLFPLGDPLEHIMVEEVASYYNGGSQRHS